MLPLYAPGANCRAAGRTETTTLAGVVPLPGVALSQLPTEEVVKVNATAPGPVSDSVVEGGREVAGCVKENATARGVLVTRPPLLVRVKIAGVPTPATVALTA